MAYKTREQWLNAFVRKAKPVFKKAGAPIPQNVRVSIGFPSAGARSKTIGECWSDSCSADGTFEIFITPNNESDSRIADILTHELIHAAAGLEAKHGPEFKRIALAVGLGGKMTATVATDEWHEWADPILEKIGSMPHAQLDPRGGSTRKPKQSTRMIKCTCDTCELTFRTTRKWLDSVTRCPDDNCDGQMGIEL